MKSSQPTGTRAAAQQDRDAVRLVGPWTVAQSASLEPELTSALPSGDAPLRLDASGIESFDTVGALVLARAIAAARAQGRQVDVVGLSPEREPLLEMVTSAVSRSSEPGARPPRPRPFSATLAMLRDRSYGFLSFLGEVFLAAIRTLLRPDTIRWGSFLRNLQTAGADAVPIIGLLSFLIGVVIAYQGAVQLHRYGADIFIVDLVGLSMVRELAPLMTAIIVAGRTGASYAAQIGTMKVTEEVDALQVLALSPIDVLVIPKVLALIIALPLLTAFADIVGILGGVIMTASMTMVGPRFFLEQFPRVVSPEAYLVGIGKAPVFAVVIATVGCYQGFRASGSAESVGAQTTVSVVQSIFLIIVLDAMFSIVFSMVGI